MTKLLFICGPSGVGKDTIINAWCERRAEVRRIVTYTTREPRSGEVDGVDYNFVSVTDFIALINDGALSDSVMLHGNMYGVPILDIDNENGILILDVDIGGWSRMKAKYTGVKSVFVNPPSIDELERRLFARGGDAGARMAPALAEMRFADLCDYSIVNDSIEEVLDTLDAITGLQNENSTGHETPKRKTTHRQNVSRGTT